MRRLFAVGLLTLCVAGCRGKNGKDGTSGGSMQRIEGTNSETTWGVQVDTFDSGDTVNVYYALASDAQTFFEMRGPDTPSTSTPYFEFGVSGSGVLVRMHNLPMNSSYRILVFRPSTVI